MDEQGQVAECKIVRPCGVEPETVSPSVKIRIKHFMYLPLLY